MLERVLRTTFWIGVFVYWCCSVLLWVFHGRYWFSCWRYLGGVLLGVLYRLVNFILGHVPEKLGVLLACVSVLLL